jgi:methionine--tRNA ligase beta chain
MVSFEEFRRVELKVAKIVTVEDIPGKDKLYKLSIDIGEEKPRTIVAGLKPFYSKAQMEGKQIVVVANLDPKPLAGILSEGMLLAVKNKAGEYSLLTVESETEPGTRVE